MLTEQGISWSSQRTTCQGMRRKYSWDSILPLCQTVKSTIVSIGFQRSIHTCFWDPTSHWMKCLVESILLPSVENSINSAVPEATLCDSHQTLAHVRVLCRTKWLLKFKNRTVFTNGNWSNYWPKYASNKKRVVLQRMHSVPTFTLCVPTQMLSATPNEVEEMGKEDWLSAWWMISSIYKCFQMNPWNWARTRHQIVFSVQ